MANKSKEDLKLIRALWVTVGIGLCFSPATQAQNVFSDAILQEITTAIQKYYLNPPPREAVLQISPQNINDFLKALDPHSRYLTADEHRLQREEDRNAYSGIGVEIARNEHRFLMIPFTNGPAYKAGIKHRQYLLAVDGQITHGMSLNEVGRLLAGPADSTVALRLAPTSSGESRDITLVRELFTPPSVEVMMDSNRPYVRIRNFIAHETRAALKVAVKHMKEGGLPVILDLRDCLGGDLHEALDAASLFLPAVRVLATVVDNAGQARSFLSLANQRVVTEKILVLVGSDTASSAEVFAAALQYYRQALLVGQRTRGKWTSQTCIELSDGSALKLTNLKILDRTRAFRDGQGLLPDIAVTEGEVFETTRLITKGLEEVRQD